MDGEQRGDLPGVRRMIYIYIYRECSLAEGFSMTGNLRWWLINGTGGAIVLFGSFFLTLAVMDAQNVSVPDEVRKGAPFQIFFHQKACDANLIGEFSCARPYDGRYSLANNSWTITGRTRSRTNLTTRSDNNAPSTPGSITIWGATGSFDRSGQLTMSGGVVGTVDLVEKPLLRRLF
jgi:hypothetical protein